MIAASPIETRQNGSSRTGFVGYAGWNWACVRMDRIGPAEMRELVLDAWAFCVPKKVLAAYKAGQAA